MMTKKFLEFPAPLEVDRYLYAIDRNQGFECKRNDEFPAPREVDRYLYFSVSLTVQ